MADKRISQLGDRGTVANNDVVAIVVSGAVTTNKATISSIQTFMQGNLDLGVTSVGITLGSSGTDVSVTGSPITTSGNITINIPTASAANRGVLSAADYITFNSKQGAITLTTTGTSGAATFVSNTLNIPNYAQDLTGFVTLGTAQTITAQKTFTGSGSSDTMIISHGSGSGLALDVIKGGNGPVIRVLKTSGSGNAMTVQGGNFEAPAIVKTGGTSVQFLMADGSVNTNVLASGAYLPLAGGTLTGPLNGTSANFTNNVTIDRSLSTLGNALTLTKGSDADQAWLAFQQGAAADGVWRLGYTGDPYDFRINLGSNASIGTQALRIFETTQNVVIGTSTSDNLSRLQVGGAATIGGGVTLTGAQTIQTSTGNLTLASAAGNGNIVLSAHGDGNVTTNDSIFIGSNSGINYGGLSNKLSVAATNYNLFDVSRFSNDNDGPRLYLGKSRGTTIGSNVIVQNGDLLGLISFEGDCGEGFVPSATISAEVDGVPGLSSDMPGRLIFKTNSDNTTFATERLRISSTGAATFSSVVGINRTPSSGFKLDIQGNEGIRILDNDVLRSIIITPPNSAASGIISTASGQGISFQATNASGNLTFETAGTERMRITSAGKVIVGTSYMTYPVSIEAQSGGGQLALTRSGAVAEFFMGGTTGGSTELYVRSGGSGGVLLTAGSTGWVSASDIRLKDIEKPIKNAIESLSTLQTVYYSWKDSENKSLHIGFIAQEVEEVFPEVVTESSIDGMKGVKYTELIPVLVAAIKELKTEIDSLKNQMQ